MRRKSPFRRMMAVVLVIVFAFVGFNFGKMFFGDNAESRLTEVTNIIVAGVDVDGYRTDLILFVQVNNIDKKVSVLQIPRDTKVNNKRNDKKINSAYFSGIDDFEKRS